MSLYIVFNKKNILCLLAWLLETLTDLNETFRNYMLNKCCSNYSSKNVCLNISKSVQRRNLPSKKNIIISCSNTYSILFHLFCIRQSP